MRVDGLARGPGGSRGEVEHLWVTFGMVKLLEEPRLMEVNMMLAGLQTGSSVIEGRLDLYSCKLAGADKEVSKSLEQSYLDELASLEALGSSPASAPGTSPVGPLTDSSNRKTLITLILTLNASFPDYDFSSLRKWRTCHPARHRIVRSPPSCLPQRTLSRCESAVCDAHPIL